MMKRQKLDINLFVNLFECEFHAVAVYAMSYIYTKQKEKTTVTSPDQGRRYKLKLMIRSQRH